MTTRSREKRGKIANTQKKDEGQGKGKWEIVWKRRRRSGRAGDRRKLLPDTLFSQQYKNKMKIKNTKQFATIHEKDEKKSQTQFSTKQEQKEE